MSPNRAANTRRLLWVPTGGGEPVDAGLEMSGLDCPTPSPDGSRLLFEAWQNVTEIWAIDRLLPPSTVAKGPVPTKK
jgi:hypothetical protein